MVLNLDTYLQNGKYRIIRVLGQGGFGITYLAEHTMLDKMVAIKEFFPKEYCDRDENTSHLIIGTKNSVDIVEMLKGKFIKEAKNISKLNHKNIITIYDIFQENDTAYYVMEYVEGASLSQIIKEQGPMSECKAVSYIQKVADAVGYMHSLSMNHLDLKPANIMVRTMDDEPILIDFGLSKQYDASGGQTSTTPIGISHGFAPIEQYRPGGVATFTPQTDIYALGATLYNLLSGSLPPHYSEILEDELPALPAAISKRCVFAIEHAMSVKKNKRPVSVTEFVVELCEVRNNNLGEINNQVYHNLSNKDTEPKSFCKVQDSAEETKMIGDFVVPQIIGINKPINNIIEFVDLGLSVKWANMNIGATNEIFNGQYFTTDNMNVVSEVLSEYDLSDIPCITEIEELIDKCDWRWFYRNNQQGFEITGSTGNHIILPACGLSFLSQTQLYGVYWSREAFLSMKNLFLYINSKGVKLTEFNIPMDCPIRLVKR